MEFKGVLVKFPVTMLAQMALIARKENRTRADLVREAVRRYIAQTNQGAELQRHQFKQVAENSVTWGAK